ncbi:hypothetical protein GGX14DRAFT_378783, partial [Mycena pura]
PRTVRKLPGWLQAQFDAKVELARPRNKDGVPALYEHNRTFWFPVEDPYFALQEINSISPQKMFQASFFLWDPAALLGQSRIPCPMCRTGLNRHGHVERPRRCVDLDHSFWIIGYRYICPSCVHPRSKKKTVTFRSWDPRIIQNLPRSLALSFPALLTHRSGISESVFMFMRSCFQSGMGAKQFSDALRVRHLESYETLELKYLSTLAKLKGMSSWLGKKYLGFTSFEDTSSNGFNGFIPSSQWLRDLYDKFIETHDHDFNQAIALLTGLICAIDHSFKLAKHIAKVDGEQVFIALLTITNEKGEIRVCNLVATKSHSQFELSLNRMRESLERYGHDQPQIFYTDNMSDKDFLERCFPSLREDVIAVEKYSHLEALEIPPTTSVIIMDEVDRIDEAMRSILHDIPEDDEDSTLLLFLDSEWNVETSERGYVTGRGATAILQLAYQDKIYIIQLGQMLAGGRLPLVLKQVLQNPRILKVGRSVAADLKYLQDACNSPLPFVEQLSESQIRYAALDVHACRCIYNSLARIPIPSPLPTIISIGTSVLLFNDDRTRLIARGKISALDGSYDGINITKARCLITVTEVVVSAAILKTHGKRTLSSFGSTPFSTVCLQSHLRLSTELAPPSVPPSPPSLNPETTQVGAVPPPEIDSLESDFGALLETELDSAEPHSLTALVDCEADPQSKAAGTIVLAEAAYNWGVWKNVIRSRVLKDPFHIFNMFYISVAHGLRVEFARALRDAIFIPDPADKARIISWGLRQSPPQDWNSFLRKSSKWLWRRCKRIIPPPEELYPLVAAVFETFGPLKDAKSGLPLFNASAWAVAKNVLELIQKGFLSDPPGIPLYYVLGIDKHGFPLLRNPRGTNYTEGGVHTHLRSHLPTSGASIRHLNASLKDFICRHNLIVGFFNSMGIRFAGHYSIWLTNERQESLSFLEDVLINPQLVTGWVNGNLYQQTDEVTGVLPIPEDVRIKSGMAHFEASVDSERLHHHLASLQGTRKAILPVHNQEEKDLFRDLMSGNDSFGNFSSETQVNAGVRIWNSEADRQERIYYKLAEQLKVYFNGDWQRSSNITQTKATTGSTRIPLLKRINDPKRLQMVPSIPETTLKLPHVPSGLLSFDPDTVDTSLLVTHPLSPKPAPEISYSALSSGTSAPSTIAATQFRSEASAKRERQSRTCRKCAIDECPGKGKVDYCVNKCRDCGKAGQDKSCIGRNPKFKTKKCFEAKW